MDFTLLKGGFASAAFSHFVIIMARICLQVASSGSFIFPFSHTFVLLVDLG
jgi:hypothetical protein